MKPESMTRAQAFKENCRIAKTEMMPNRVLIRVLKVGRGTSR